MALLLGSVKHGTEVSRVLMELAKAVLVDEMLTR
jgi:hypothetical protein